MKWRRQALAVVVVVAVVALAAAAAIGARAADDARRSGFAFMSPQTQAMQRDDTQNPAMLWVQDGAALWAQAPASAAATAGPPCAGCHGDAAKTMRGVAARYPRFDAAAQRPLALPERINACRERHQHAPPWAAESQPLLALEAYVALQSRGLPIAPDADPRLAPWRERGDALYRGRIGQLDIACSQCHDDHAGQRLGGSVIPQALPTAYPLYRLEWQGLGSLYRRLRNCMTGVRAEPFAAGAPQWVELELYLKARAAGMASESPGVRP